MSWEPMKKNYLLIMKVNRKKNCRQNLLLGVNNMAGINLELIECLKIVT